MYYNNKRLLLSIFWIVLGIVILVMAMTGKLEAVYGGMGGALIGVGAMQVLRNIRYRNNEEYREKIDIESNDERNRYIRMKAWSYTGYITILALCAAGIVFYYVMGNKELGQPVMMTVCFMLVVYWISYYILSKKQ
ncbi:MAG: hypothetical protein IK069_03525 [Firmicutes bacterium]|nr:hypothetical protein [Bacillota bacterium]